ncbi:hypothetical protein LX32DRAFT_645040 [Colletotrichum zoysiae]|uniref:Uncharacterized protein n=1 Tax=Colletotrichum zoysiae TaxID=1216348 RepID=A0AAD9LYH7_9PEZI|nr:hypothetical protein LX32DRAFT_645040 [Colletotrichum zoysiae]
MTWHAKAASNCSSVLPPSVISVPTSSRGPGLRPATLALPSHVCQPFWASTRRRLLAWLQLPLSTAEPLAKASAIGFSVSRRSQRDSSTKPASVLRWCGFVLCVSLPSCLSN